jgi:hypothetical protein
VEQHWEKELFKARRKKAVRLRKNSLVPDPDINLPGFGMAILIFHFTGDGEPVGMTYCPLHRGAASDEVAVAGGPVIGKSIARCRSSDSVDIGKRHERVGCHKALVFKWGLLGSRICSFIFLGTGRDHEPNDYQYSKSIFQHRDYPLLVINTNVYILSFTYGVNIIKIIAKVWNLDFEILLSTIIPIFVKKLKSF